MESFMKVWPEIESRHRKGLLVLFLDYDGTLTPIVRRPGSARLAPSIRALLKKTSRAPQTFVAIVSGRTLTDIARRVRIPGLIYSGNHGLECRGPGNAHFLHSGASRARPVLSRLARQLRRMLRPCRSVWVENKRFSLSVHFRGASRKETETARRGMLQAMRIYASEFVCSEGKKVWEIRPKFRWNKGAMALYLLSQIRRLTRKRPLAVYIGDDRTDEDAFRALKKRAWTVKVTRKKNPRTLARYRLASVREVHRFLRRLA
jgi:trehalose-phosphatase